MTQMKTTQLSFTDEDIFQSCKFNMIMQIDNAKLMHLYKKSHIDLLSQFNQQNWKKILYKIFVALNLSFQIIENEHFRQLLQMLRSEITFVHYIKLSSMIFLKYDEIHAKIKQDLKESRQISIALNAWSSS